VSSNPDHVEVYTIQHNVTKVYQSLATGWRFSPPRNQIFKVNVKLDHILLNDTIWVSQTYSTVAILIDGLVYGVSCHFQQYFSYIVVVSFSGGENRNTRRKLPICASRWQTLSHNCLSSLTWWVRTPLMARVYSIQHYVIKFVSDLRRSVVFSWYSGFLHHVISTTIWNHIK
jgi:hypothetical protein